MDEKELSVAMAKPPTTTDRRTPEFEGRRGLPTGPGMPRAVIPGRGRPMVRASAGGPRGMTGGYGDMYDSYTGYEGYGMDYGYGTAYGAGGAAYEMTGMALVPMYLPNGQVGFVFQQHRAAPPAPGSGGPMRKVTGAGGPTRAYSGNVRSERGTGDYGGYGGYQSQRNQRGPGRTTSNSGHGSSSRGSGSSSRYRPY